MISFLRSDPGVNQYVKRRPAETKEKALGFIEKINSGIKDGHLYYWKITQIGQPDMIGSICLWNFSKNNKIAEIGYDLHPRFQSQGIMTECILEIAKYAFQELQLESMVAYTQFNNKSSVALLKRSCFKLVTGKKDKDNSDNIIFELKRQERRI